MRCALDRFDEQALVAFLIDRADVAAIDLQVRQTQPRQVADHAEAPAEALQAQRETELAQASGQLLQHRLFRQLLLADFQSQTRAEIGMRAQNFEDFVQRLRVGQRRRGQVQRQRILVPFHLFEHAFEHQPIEPRGPAEALQPRQKAPGGNGLALLVEQARQDLVMQHQLRVLRSDHRLEIQLETLLTQGLIQQSMPSVMIVTDLRHQTLIDARPILLALPFGLRECLIAQCQHRLRGVTVGERRQPDRSHRRHIGRAGGMQAAQGIVEILRQLQRFLAHQPRRQHGEFTAANTRDQVLGLWISGALAGQLLTDSLEQLVGTLAAETLVEPGQILDPQQQQITGTGLLRVAHPVVQLHLEIAAVGQPCEVVLIGLGAQFFAALGLLLKQRLELLDHLIHCLHHATQFRRARQIRQAEKLAAGNRMGLLDHVIEGLQLPTQQQRAEHRTQCAADQQPAKAAQCALP